MRRCPIALILASLLAPLAVHADDPSWIARSKSGMVASDSSEASQAGADVLTQGGNAFDAAVTTSLALSITRPGSTGLGGGGFLVAYVADKKQFVALDFRECAPAAATAELYAKLHAQRKADEPSPSEYGGYAIGVPGLVAGLAQINERWGRWQWPDTVRAAVKLCEAGFTADEHHVSSCKEALADFQKHPEFVHRFPQLYSLIQPDGKLPTIGSRVRRPDLGSTMQLLMRQGPQAFYEGPIAQTMVDAVRAAGGTLTLEDLKSYNVKVREPLRFKYGEYEFITMPPPSSGGVCMAEALGIMAAIKARGVPDTGKDRPHALLESMKHAFADRTLLGDPDATPLPLGRLMSLGYSGALASRVALDRVQPNAQYGAAAAPSDFGGGITPGVGSPTMPDDGGTSHFCVADSYDNIVAMTETVNGLFGSFVVAAPCGIVLNNEMDDFTTAEGQANLFGLVQGKANLVAPGKRPLSSMTPTIILKNGKSFLTLGGSGGPRIISNVLQVALHAIEGKPLEEALTAVRLHHQWQPDEVNFDREPPPELVADLKTRGHTISGKRKAAVIQAIQFLEDGTKVGASDPKKGGKPWAAR